MNMFWAWFYEQLEQQPEEDVERLHNAAEQAVEAPLGREPQESARLLQSRIGNQAMQRLIQMKTRQQGGQKQEQETEQSGDKAPTAEEVEAVTVVTKQEELPGLTEVADEAPQTEQETQRATVERNTEAEPTKEEELALALRRFIATLETGGGITEWAALTIVFKQINDPAQQKTVQILGERVFTLEQTSQIQFMQNLQTWRNGAGDDDLATQLWLRLFHLRPVTESQGPGDND